MSAFGGKAHIPSMSAIPPKADMGQHGQDVRFVPKADSCTAAKTGLYTAAENSQMPMFGTPIATSRREPVRAVRLPEGRKARNYRDG
jgi:hypothetical protein